MMRQASENSSVWQSYIVNKQVRAAEAMQRSRKCKTAEARNALIDSRAHGRKAASPSVSTVVVKDRPPVAVALYASVFGLFRLNLGRPEVD